jgi:hypothetical protein
MPYKEIVGKLLEHGVCEKPLMLHGATLEATMLFLENGYLPTGIPRSDEKTTNRLHFFPVTIDDKKRSLPEINFADRRKRALANVCQYACENSVKRYILSELGIPLDKEETDLENAVFMNLAFRPGTLTELDFLSFFEVYADYVKDYGSCVKRIGAKKIREILNKARKRHGVIFEANERALQYYEKNPEITEGICLYCPEGIGHECFDGILVLSELERKMLYEKIS